MELFGSTNKLVVCDTSLSKPASKGLVSLIPVVSLTDYLLRCSCTHCLVIDMALVADVFALCSVCETQTELPSMLYCVTCASKNANTSSSNALTTDSSTSISTPHQPVPSHTTPCTLLCLDCTVDRAELFYCPGCLGQTSTPPLSHHARYLVSGHAFHFVG